jgi:methylenetetrahydrofolate dehydrogenase (NADP+)/methenyltetrahydrofolate cyclohydrolase
VDDQGALTGRIDGTQIAAEIRARAAAEAAELARAGAAPCLAAVLIGDDPSAASYARSQARQAESAGIDYRLVQLPAGTTPDRARQSILDLNADPSVSGIMLHLPVPAPLEAVALQEAIDPARDVEGVGAANFGRLAMGRDALVPCTAAAAFACLRRACGDLAGREAVVVGRSNIVGKPLAMLLLAAHATVTQCHTRTRNLPAHTRRAELLLVAAGVPGLIGAEHVAEGAVVIDVGTHRVARRNPDGTSTTVTVGDVRFEEVAPRAAAITPVPGGVGPVTVAMLLANTVDACRRSRLPHKTK